MKRMIKQSGFTLIELVIVVVILAILVSVATPKYFNIVEKSKQAEAIEILTRIYRGHKVLEIDENASSSWSDLGFEDNVAPVGEYFTYSYDGASDVARADRIDFPSRWLSIDLVTGNITKSSPY